MSFLQTVSNWLLGDYKVRTTKLSDNSLVQHVRLTDDDGAYVSGGGGGSGDGALLDGVSSSIKATVLDLTSSNPLTVGIVDSNGDQITSFGGGTQYTEGATDATITGTAVLMEVAADTLQPVQGTVADGLLVNLGANNDVTVTGTVAVTQSGTWDEVGINDSGNSITVDYATTGSGTATGALRVELPTNGTGVIATVGAVTAITNALPAGTNNIGDVDVLSLPALAAGTNNIGDVDVLTVPTDPFGANADAASATGSISAKLRFIAATGIPITGTVTVGAHAVTASGAAAHDAAASGLGPVLVGGYANAAAPADVSTDVDSVRAWYLRNGAQATVLTAAGALIGGDATNGLDVDVTRVTGTVTVGGDVAHDGVDSGSPIKCGGQARTTNPTAVADADRANFITDKLGKQIVVGAIRDLKGHQITTITSSTTETTIITAAASTFHDLYGIIATNTSATSTEIHVKDATAGTTRFTLSVPTLDSRGFMLPVDSGLVQASVNNNWTATCADSVASVIITALYVKNT